MMDQSVYVAWIIAIDLAALILAATAAKRMTKGILKGAYFAFLVTGIVWVNLIFLVRYFPVLPDVAVYLSRGIFVSILATLTAFGFFMVVFCGMNQELRTLRFGAFIVWNGVLGVLSAAGFVENGLKQTEFGLAPIYGPFHPVLILSNFAWGAYIFWMVWRAFSVSHNPVFKNQLRMLFAYCLFTFLWAGVINGVLPAVFGTSRYSHIGPLGFLVLYLGILRIVGEERNLFVERDLKALLKLQSFDDHRNVFGLKQLFVAVEDMLEAGQQKTFRRGIQFAALDGSSIEAEFLAGEHPQTTPVALGHAQGLLQNMRILEEHNRRMAFALIQAQSTLRDTSIEKTLQDAKPVMPHPLGDHYSWEEFAEIIARNRREMIDTYGADMLCFSRGRLNTLIQVKGLAPSRLNTTFTGENGSGRGTLARILHHLRGGKLLEEIRCDALDVESLKARLVSMRTDVDGLLLRDLDVYPAEHINSLIPLLLREERYLYMTAALGFPVEAVAARLHPRVLGALTQVIVNVDPLRQHREELFYAIIDITHRKLAQMKKRSTGISKKLVDSLLQQNWPRNYEELNAELEKLVLWDSAPVLGSVLQIEETAPAASLPELPEPDPHDDLTPLERAEKRTILAHLQKNSFNQRFTSKELGIRPNTLILKMRKYGIKRPGRDGES
jgi:transcriptional regulator with AAA-type ATPase domain